MESPGHEFDENVGHLEMPLDIEEVEEDISGNDDVAGGPMDPLHFIPYAPEDIKPKAQQEFKSEQEAFSYYNSYAKVCGFSIRRSQIRRLKNGELSRRILRCSRAGTGPMKPIEMEKRSKRARPVTRCKCPALIYLKKGVRCSTWKITRFEEQHNHKLMTPNKSHYLRLHRGVPNSHLDIPYSLSEVRIGVARSFDFMMAESSGLDCVGFLDRDVTNGLRKKRQDTFGSGAFALLTYFQEKSKEDSNFTYKVQVDNERQLMCCFWVHGTSKKDYQAFNDVICFHIASKANEDDMPFGSFVGVNHHKQSVLLGAGLLFGETRSDFKWLFETWLNAMDGISPKAIATDQDEAIIAAVADVFPQSHHQLFVSQVNKILPEKLNHLYQSYPTFKSTWNNVVNKSEEIEDFEWGWSKMIEEYSLQNNTWLSHMYSIRKMWIKAFYRSIFLAGTKTTQQSESLHSMLDAFVNHKTELLEFAMGYDSAITRQHDEELKADAETANGTPMLKTKYPIEAEMMLIYTREIFLEFQEEVEHSNYYNIDVVEVEGSVTKYIASHCIGEENCMKRMVTWDSTEEMAWCSCCTFEFEGIICRHILAMFQSRHIMCMPEKHILKRWTRAPKERCWSGACSSLNSIENSSYLRQHILLEMSSYLVNEGTCNFEAYVVVKDFFERAKAAIEVLRLNDKRTLPSAGRDHFQPDEHPNCDNMNAAQDDGSGSVPTQSSQVEHILDPNAVQTKGRTTKRYKTVIEQSRLGQDCAQAAGKRVVGHNKLTCPLHEEQALLKQVNKGCRGRGRGRGRQGKQ